METFSALLVLFAGNSRITTGKFHWQRPVMRSFDVFFFCAWINDWVNSREAGDLRRRCAHYDGTVINYTQIYPGNGFVPLLTASNGAIWCYYMMTSSNGNIFRVTGHLCGEFPGEFPTQRPVTRSFDVFFDLRPNGEAGDLRRYRVHYDVIVMQDYTQERSVEFLFNFMVQEIIFFIKTGANESLSTNAIRLINFEGVKNLMCTSWLSG